MNKTLLTIAIPTWNRADILACALNNIIPQILENYKDIEFIVSDNHSDDNTKEVILKYKKNNPEINFTAYFQEKNIGYFGNFKKCRELANGKYFWLLSDNEHILPNTLDRVIKALKKKDEIGLIFLNNNKISTTEYISVEKLIKKYNYKLTLVSTIIMLNSKKGDKALYDNYLSNTFLGFLFTLTVMKDNNKMAVISGENYKSVPAKVNFNIFHSWTKDMFECLSFAKSNNILNDDLIIILKENFLKNVLKIHLFNYKLYGKLVGRKYGLFNQVYNKLKDYYGDLDCFHEVTDYIYKTPRIILLTQFYFKKLLKKTRTIYQGRN